MADAATITKRLGALVGLRSPNESTWRDCFNYTFPLRGSGFQSQQLNAQSGQDKRAQLVDGTATDSARILASGIMSGVTPANSLWFQLGVQGENEDDRRWLEQAGQMTFEAIHGANFDSAAFECMLDVVAAGWFALYIEGDKEDPTSLVFEQWPLSEVYIAASKRGGRIDTVYRQFELSAEAALAEYGEENISEATEKLSREKPDEMVQFVHAIYPRTRAGGYIPGSQVQTRLAIASCHVEVKAKKIVREGGYPEMPVVVARWHKLPSSAYAVGPAFDALPDTRMLNELKTLQLQNADIAVSGMWKAVDDGVLNPSSIKIGARKVVPMADINSMAPLETGADFNLSFTLETRLQAAIRKIFMADQLQPQDGPQMTATEVHVRVGLIRQLLGPVYGRLQSEYLAPMIERCFGILSRAGVFPPAPDTLSGRDYSVRYISPLARAQRQEEVTAMDQFENTLLAEAQEKPEVLDVYDWDAAATERGKLLGVPAKLVRSKDDIDQIRQGRVQAQQQQQQQAILAQGATAAAAAGGQALGNRLVQ
jgi:hypothetical protein